MPHNLTFRYCDFLAHPGVKCPSISELIFTAWRLLEAPQTGEECRELMGLIADALGLQIPPKGI